MSDAGYTVAEALAALVIVSLSVTGMVKGAQAIGTFQQRSSAEIHDATSAKAVDRQLGGLFQGQGPFLSTGTGGLRGTASQLEFPCGPATCAASLLNRPHGSLLVIRGLAQMSTTSRSTGLSFQYRTASASFDHWPVARSINGQPVIEPLLAVSLVGPGSDAAVATARIWKEQSAGCAYDSITKACRGAGS